MKSRLFPFCVSPHDSEWLVDLHCESPTECPIPPCDCQPNEPHGSLTDIAMYLGANEIWQDGIDGDGVVVGIVDGGLLAKDRIESDCPSLIARVIDGWPIENWGTISGWRGHGNMLAYDILGIAPRASLHDIRIGNWSSEGGHMSDAIAGIQWAIEKYRATATPHILCCGWGIYQEAHDPIYARDESHPLTQKIVEALDEGILVVFAVGNGGQSCPAKLCGDDVGPGKSIWGANGHPRVMTVAAVNKNEQLIGYSSQGPAALHERKPDFCGISHFKGYFPSDSGTSVGCATVAGVLALLKQARPSLTQEAAKRLLVSTAKDIGPPGWDRHSGAGIIQAKAAYEHVAEHRDAGQVQAATLKRLEVENRCLRELVADFALARKVKEEALKNAVCP